MKQCLEQYVTIWNDKNVSNLEGVLKESSNYWDAAQHGGALEIIHNSILATHEAFPDIFFKIIKLNSASNNEFYLEWLMTGTNTGSFFGAAPTGKKIEIRGLDYIVCESDKISSIQSFYDSALFSQQLELQ